jgi:hypothetical protein
LFILLSLSLLSLPSLVFSCFVLLSTLLGIVCVLSDLATASTLELLIQGSMVLIARVDHDESTSTVGSGAALEATKDFVAEFD